LPDVDGLTMQNLLTDWTFIFGLPPLATGFRAAYLWWKASEVRPKIGQLEAALLDQPESGEDLDRLETSSGLLNEKLLASIDAANESAVLNRRAAIWTAGSVVFGVVSVVLVAVQQRLQSPLAGVCIVFQESWLGRVAHWNWLLISTVLLTAATIVLAFETRWLRKGASESIKAAEKSADAARQSAVSLR
jgi:hypothetical protein